MKNYVDIAKRIQLVNNYTFKKKEECQDETAMHQFNDLSGIQQNNLSDINFNKEFSLVNEMIPLTNRNNLSEIIPNAIITNGFEKKRNSQEESSSLNQVMNTTKIRNRSNTMKDSHIQNKPKKNFAIDNVVKQNESMYIQVRKSDFNNGHLNKFITNNLLDGRNSLLGDRMDRSNLTRVSDTNVNRDRSQVNRSNNNSFTVPTMSDYSPNPRNTTNNIENSYGNINYNSASPQILQTFSHHPYGINPNTVNMYYNVNNGGSNSYSNVGVSGKKLIEVKNNVNNVNNSNLKRNSKKYDYNRPSSIKKGMFSYAKPSTPPVEKLNNSGLDLNNFLNLNSNNKNAQNNSNNYNNPGRISNFSNFNNLNAISRHLNSLQNNDNIIPRDASQSLLDNSHISLVEKYQIKKDQSSLNLNKSENLLDETDKISVKSMISTSSMNLNKYKIGLNGFSTSKITSLNDNTRVSDLSTLIKFENSSNNANYGKVLIEGYNQDMNQTKKIESDEQSQYWKENYQNPLIQNENAIRAETEGYSQSSRREMREQNLDTKYTSEFKNRPVHERESRRMQIELVKLNLKDKEGITDIMKIINELKLNPIILDRPRANEEELYSNSNNNFNALNSNSASTKKLTLISDPRLQSILRRERRTITNTYNSNNNNYPNMDVVNSSTKNTHLNNNMNTHVPNSESASSYITNTIKSTAHLNYSLEEDSNDRINMLCFLVTPRLLYINITIANKTKRIPFIFQLSPTNACHKYGLEHYIFQWCDVNTLSPVGMIDLLKINSCSAKSSNQKEIDFVIDVVKYKTGSDNPNTSGTLESVRYELSSNSPNQCLLYINSLNFVSQLVKCKAYAFKGNEKGRG